MFRDKNVFISGATGVIGSEMVDKLIAQGANLFVGDLKPCPEKWFGKLNYRQGDLNYLTQDELQAFEPEYFIHLAATFERSAETYDFWYENFRHNVQLSNYLMSLMKDLDSLKSVIYASSYLIYDPKLYNFSTAQSAAFSLKETDPIYPRNLTGMAKLSHEIELRFLENFRKDNFTIGIARIYRGYGRNSRDVISRWIRALLNNEEIKVYRPEGIFDYVYAKDSAEGLLRLAYAQAKGIVNLGTGKSRKVSEIVDILRKFFPNLRESTEESDIPFEASQAETILLKKITNWTTEFTLEQAIEEIVEFEKKRIQDDETSFGNILITSSAKKIPLIESVRKAANKIDPQILIFGGDMNESSLSFNYTDGKFIMPKTIDEKFSDILSWCQSNNVKFVIPTRDGELEFWARKKDTFRETGIFIMVSELESIHQCVDKLLFSKMCSQMNIPAIPSALKPGDIFGDKYVVKERLGAGSESIGINLTLSQAEEHAKSLSEPIFQPMVVGKEISADAYVTKEGVMKGLITRYRSQVENGESVISETFYNEKVHQTLQESISKLKLYGHVILQAFIADNGDVNIIECNTRFGGASTLSLAAGLDSFYWFLLESKGFSVKDYYFVPAKRSIKQIRASRDKLVYGSSF